MEVAVKLYGGLAQQTRGRTAVTLAEPAVAADLLRSLGLADHDVEIIVVNGDIAQFDTPLHHNDKVSLMPFIGGG